MKCCQTSSLLKVCATTQCAIVNKCIARDQTTCRQQHAAQANSTSASSGVKHGSIAPMHEREGTKNKQKLCANMTDHVFDKEVGMSSPTTLVVSFDVTLKCRSTLVMHDRLSTASFPTNSSICMSVHLIQSSSYQRSAETGSRPCSTHRHHCRR